MGETSIKKLGKSIIFYAFVSSICLQNYNNKKIQRCPYCFFVLSTSLAWRLDNSLQMCLWYCMLYWFHFTAGVFQIIVTVFLYSFREVGAMEIVAMDMKVRSIVLSIVKLMLNCSRKMGIDHFTFQSIFV